MHFMIDLETLSHHHDARIITIGVVAFDPLAEKPLAPPDAETTFYRCVDWVNNTGHISPETVAWWMKQSDEARYAALGGVSTITPISIPEWQSSNHLFPLGSVLQSLSLWMSSKAEKEDRIVWGHGATFDPVVLVNAYRAADLENLLPWDFRNVRDTRTLFAMTPGFDIAKHMPKEGKHIAYMDAWRQAEAVRWCCNQIEAMRVGADMLLGDLSVMTGMRTSSHLTRRTDDSLEVEHADVPDALAKEAWRGRTPP